MQGSRGMDEWLIDFHSDRGLFKTECPAGESEATRFWSLDVFNVIAMGPGNAGRVSYFIIKETEYRKIFVISLDFIGHVKNLLKLIFYFGIRIMKFLSINIFFRSLIILFAYYDFLNFKHFAFCYLTKFVSS